jgi:hypothetical protein
MKTLEMRMRAKLGRRKKVTPEQQMKYDMNYIKKKVVTGDLDLSKPSQRIKLTIALQKKLIYQDESGEYKINKEESK